MAKGKKSIKVGASTNRSKPTNWPAAISEFLLNWYIDKKQDLPPKSVIKKMHHTASTAAVNAKFATTYTVDQVHRHYRRHKDNWALVAHHMNESGGGWDEDNKMVQLSESTLAGLSVNDRGVLTKPIQFFDKLKELFSGSSADGTFMQDPSTAADSDHDDIDAFDITDCFGYDDSKDPEVDDSDKLSSDSDDYKEVAALSVAGNQVSSSSVAALKANKKNFKRKGKNTLPPSHNDKIKSRSKTTATGQDDMDQDVVIIESLHGIHRSLQQPIQVATPPDPDAPLWDMLKEIPMTPDQRMTVGMHLCKAEFKVHRNFLANMGKAYLECWVYKHLSGDDPGAV